MGRFCWHRWGEWSEALDTYQIFKVQYSKCKKCGAITTRNFNRSAISVSADDINKAVEKQ